MGLNNRDKAEIDENLRKLEQGGAPAPEPTPDPTPEPTPDPEPEGDEPTPEPEGDTPDPESDPEPEGDEPDEDPEPTPETPEKPEKKEDPQDPDYEEKFKNSTQEAMVQKVKNDKFMQTVEEAATYEPTDDELRKYVADKGSDWDDLSDFERSMAKDSLTNQKRFEKIYGSTQDARKVDEWVKKVDTFLEDDKMMLKFPKLSGREKAFKAFAMGDSRRGMNFEDLVPIFLYNHKDAKKSGQMFNNQGGGKATSKPKPTQYTAEQARQIRKSNHKLYAKLAAEGKFNHLGND